MKLWMLFQWFLAGLVNKQIVSLISKHGGNAIGLSGKDGRLVQARRLQPSSNSNSETTQDLGLVGEVERINREVLDAILDSNFIPVIAPIGESSQSETLNINADLVASAIAGALDAEKLILLTNTPGVKGADGKDINKMNTNQLIDLIANGTVHGGMLPKAKCALSAIEAGVPSVHIINGCVPHATLLEIFTNEGIGTLLEK